jgi:maltose alpha-D-glucosyltransferase / alpha-amylase
VTGICLAPLEGGVPRPRPRPEHPAAGPPGPSDPEWYKDAIIYELHVRSFQDSNGDGVGDFAGLTSRLGYLYDLGVTAIWLLPFYPSPLRDDGYDIADYRGIHPSYGTMADFRSFLDEAHRRGLRVITELVVNHTSDEHPWFQRARRAKPGHPEREFYVWSESPDRYDGARVIFQDFERSNWTWDPVAEAYYWHRFYSHQPDLNFDNPAVFEAVQEVIDYWFGLGVDGMRLDAIPYLVEREGTHSENLRQTHDVLRRLRRHVDERFSHRMLLAEANQWPEDAAAYFGNGDESHMVFHFPLMPRLFMAIRQEDRLPIVDILAQTPDAPKGCQWALFLRNHDELTLEMVTEEERQYMYYVYATDPQARINLGIRRRLAPLVGNDRRRVELMNMLLFSLPGTPILYYGDEIGMGDNIYLGDRNGVRTPMQWSADRNGGFSRANPQRLFLPLIVDDQYHYQAVHVEQQKGSRTSLLAWMTRLISLRRRFQAFGRGRMDIVDTPNPRVLAYVRTWHRQQILVVANLSRFAQHAELDLERWTGMAPVELSGRTPFPPVASEPYALSLGPHACFWFELRSDRAPARRALPELGVERNWDELFDERGRPELEAALPAYLEACTVWATGGRSILSVRIEESLRIESGRRRYVLLIVRLTFTSGEPQLCLLPLGVQARAGARTERSLVATLRIGASAQHVLYDASEDPPLASALLGMVRRKQAVPGTAGVLEAIAYRPEALSARSQIGNGIRRERRGPNALVDVGGAIVLKLFKQLDIGPNPEVELCTHLNAAGFAHAPALHGSLIYRPYASARGDTIAIGILEQFVENEGEAWPRAVRAARAYFTRAARRRRPARPIPAILPALDDGTDAAEEAGLSLGAYVGVIRLIAVRTADLHRTLAVATTDPDFVPEPLNPLSQRSAYQRMRTLAVSVTATLRRQQQRLPRQLRRAADVVVARQGDAMAVFHALLERPMQGLRIRDHGNLHLGQVLHTGDDIMLIDFEGEPGRPVYERRLKRSPMHDVAAMVRSFHNAAHAARQFLGPDTQGKPAPPWLRRWQQAVGTVFVTTYLDATRDTGLLPADRKDLEALLRAHLLERAYYELRFELTHRPQWVQAPLLDIPVLMGEGGESGGSVA